MYAAREREVCFDCITASQIALDAGVDLITPEFSSAGSRRREKFVFKTPNSRTTSNRHSSVSGKRRFAAMNARRCSVELSCHRIAKEVGVEEELLLAEREVIDGA